MRFSVLMSVYYREQSKYLDCALKSIWDDQILKPDQIVLVQDGCLGEDLIKVISNWKLKLKHKLTIISLKNNVGLGGALNIGLKSCKYELIARMDSDDISTPNRFKEQVDFFLKNKDIDVLGGYIEEFEGQEGLIKYPLKNDSMLKYFGKRNPIAHVTVMYKASFFKSAGFYPTNTLLNEDTILWLNGFKSNCKFENLPLTLVKVRVNEGYKSRRGSIKKIFSDSKDRLKVISTLKLKKVNYFYVFAYILVMILPSFFKYKLISFLRYAK